MPHRDRQSRIDLLQTSRYLKQRSTGGQPCRREATSKMSTFDERKDAYENKFAHDAELRFRAEARRNRLLGHWAAEQLGKTGPDADAYSLSVIQADLEEAGDDDVFRKIRGDFDEAGVTTSDADIRRQMDEMLIAAAEQIERDG